MDHAAEPPDGIRNPVLRVLVYGHVWLALGAAAQTWWMQTVLSGAGWRAPALAFCGTMVLYNFMRLARMNHPELGTSVQMAWTRRNRKYLLLTAIACGLIATVLALPFVVVLWCSLWPALVLAVFYVIPFGWTGGRTIGLRRVPGLKALFIAFVWAWTTVKLPLAVEGLVISSDAEPLFLALQFAFFLSLAITFDIRDMDRDPRSLRTLPQMIGQRWAKVVSIILQLPWLLLFLLGLALDQQAGENNIHPQGSLMMWWLLPMIGSLMTIRLIGGATPERNDTYYSVGLDGVLILIPLLGWTGRLL
ncbi:MAG: hypothetical protein IPI55_01390 [Flavobacteriales bacterium]|nr:hypothetical protein [Flavobacteriales bacterium]